MATRGLPYGLENLWYDEQFYEDFCRGCTLIYTEKDTGYRTCPYDWDCHHPMCERHHNIEMIESALTKCAVDILCWVDGRWHED